MKTPRIISSIFMLALGYYFYTHNDQPKPTGKPVIAAIIKPEDDSNPEKIVSKEENQKAINISVETKSDQTNTENMSKSNSDSADKNSVRNADSSVTEHILTYTIDDGLVVVQGDIVIGAVSPDKLLTRFSGPIKEPTINLWPTTKIPYYIQPNLHNPERVLQALKYFSNTNIQFIPYVDQENVLVFEQGQNTCKSYLGHIGGRQPLWISEGCTARDIAHEIMHALGFIHEQNRSDRDNYINVFWENINPKAKINFEKFSSNSMKVTGLSSFDFESIMIYPELMFSINGLPTIRSKVAEQVIFPTQALTQKDEERIHKAYSQ